MMRRLTIGKVALTFMLIGLFQVWNAQADQDRPNILWLAIEDMSVFYLPAYGNTIIETPNVDRLEEGGIVFDNAYSNGTQCSPARTTLISGTYSSTLGAEYHRNDTRYPESVFWTKQQMEKNGYWTSGLAKTDYNIKEEDDLLTTAIWTSYGESFEAAPADQPFFCFENNYDTHMSVITKTRPGKNPRDNRTVSVDDVDVPSYMPDLPLTRDDLAWYYDKIKIMDKWLGTRLDALEASGRADETIIYFFADNGGSAGGSKGFLRQDGLQVPMIAYYPEKWAHLAPASTDGRSDELIEFVDMPPSMLNMAGIEVPDYMQGRVFCGEDTDPEQDYVYGIRCNQDEFNFIPSRAITDGQYKFIWHYNTFFTKGVRNDFQIQMPGFREWEEAYRNGDLSGVQASFWEPMPTFELYDLNADPGELNNIAEDAGQAARIEEMKAVLKTKIRSTKDLGFNPSTLRDTTLTSSYYEIVRDMNMDLTPIYEAAELASTCTELDQNELTAYLTDPNPTIRYWGVAGYARLAFHEMITSLPDELYTLGKTEQENGDIRLTAAFAMNAIQDDCPSEEIFRSMGASNLVSKYLASVKYPGPLTQLIYDTYVTGGNGSNFNRRSALINTGVMSYSDLIDPSSSPVLDLSLLDNSDVLDACPVDGICDSDQVDTFSEATLSGDWAVFNDEGGTAVAVSGGRLMLDLVNGNNGNQAAERTYQTVTDDGAELTFTYNGQKNWLKAFASVVSDTGDTLGGIIFGSNGLRGIGVLSDINTLRNYSAAQGSDANLIVGDIVKDTDYNVNFSFDFTNNTYDVYVTGFEDNAVTDMPFWSDAVGLNKFNVALNSMSGQSGSIFFDNISLGVPLADSEGFDNAYQQMTDLVFNADIGVRKDQHPQSAYDQLYADYIAIVVPDECTATEGEYDALETSILNSIATFEATANPSVPVTAVEVEGEAEMVEGESQVLSAVVTPHYADDVAVTWSSSDESIATVDANGEVEAISGGQVTITCTSQFTPEISGTFDINVEAIVLVSSIEIDGSSDMIVSQTQLLTATVLPTDAHDTSVTWSSSDEAIATVDAIGQVTALAEGQVTITCTAQDASGVSSTLVITIEPIEVFVSSIVVTGETEMEVGTSQVLSAAVFPEEADNKAVTWASLDEALATVDATGEVTALAEGQVIITCTAQDGSAATDSLEISITPVEAPVLDVNEAKSAILKLWPNPVTNGVIHLDVESVDGVSYRLLNLSGSVVQQGKVVAGSSISVDAASGLYVLEVIDNAEVSRLSLIIK